VDGGIARAWHGAAGRGPVGLRLSEVVASPALEAILEAHVPVQGGVTQVWHEARVLYSGPWPGGARVHTCVGRERGFRDLARDHFPPG